jgi:hypothetical protein
MAWNCKVVLKNCSILDLNPKKRLSLDGSSTKVSAILNENRLNDCNLGLAQSEDGPSCACNPVFEAAAIEGDIGLCKNLEEVTLNPRQGC